MNAAEKTRAADKYPNRYKCAICLYSSEKLSHYTYHMRTHSNEKPYKCTECPYRTKQKSSVKTHLQNVHLLQSAVGSARPFPCPESGCNYAAKQKSDLIRHSKIHSHEKSLFCSHPNCNFATHRKGHFVEHARIHSGEKPFVCQFESCSYATAYSSVLVVHSRIHTKEKPYKCPEPNCEYSTAHSSELKRHQLAHEPKDGDARPSFSCPLCEYSGKTKANLNQHIKRHTLEKFFKCDEPNCNFEAKTKTHLKSHKAVHADEKPFVCSFDSCEFRSKWKSHLFDHLKTHSNEKQYKCELCPFRAKKRQIVTAHLKTVHSGLRRFKCTEPKCESAFKTKGSLTKHLLIHKGENN